MSCPEPHDLIAFADGSLTQAWRERIESHLGSCDECRQVLGALVRSSTPPVGMAATLPSDLAPHPPVAPAPTSVLERGLEIDHYRIERVIGRGGMGEVYLATDRNLRRPAALKVIRPDLVGAPDAVSRFLVEARAAARLNHPHIVTVYGIGEFRGTPYIALEYVEGCSLRERMDRAPLGPREWLPVALAVAEGAAEAHRNGVVHGDLKPANVLLSSDGRVRTVDFGLARLARDGSLSMGSPSSGASQPSIQGTPAYMAPESWLGQPASPASDVWAFATMIVELATGTIPFSPGQVARGLELSGLVRDALCSHAALPQPVVDLIARAFELKPERRPAMAELAVALRMSEAPLPSAAPVRTNAFAVDSGAALVTAPDATLPSRKTGRSALSGVWVIALIAALAAVYGLSRLNRGGSSATAAASSSSVVEPVSSPPGIAASATAPPVSSQSAAVPAPSASAAGPVATTPRPPATTAAPPSTTAGPPATAAPPPSTRLAALAALEEQAEKADRRAKAEADPNRRRIEEQNAAAMRAAADHQVNEVERIANQSKASEPANAAVLLDYVRQAREYLCKRRAANRP